MTQDTPAFFTLDRGTVSTSAALIAPVDGRYRMLAAASAPAALEPDSLLEDLAWRVARTDASVAGSMESWRDWSRLEVHTSRPARGVLVAASGETGDLLAAAFIGAGWSIAARFFGPDPDLIALGEACLDPDIDALVVGGRDGVGDEESQVAHRLWPRVGALARFRDDVAAIACGPFAERPEGIPDGRLFSLPAPDTVAMTSESQLRQAALQVGTHLAAGGDAVATEGRAALRASVSSLAALLGERVEGIEVGMVASSRTLAAPGGELAHAVVAAAAAVPHELLSDDDAAEAVLQWCTLSADPAANMDAMRELLLHPWAHVDREGAHLRLATLRAALERLESSWSAPQVPPQEAPVSDVMVLGGGAFAELPPAVVALAVVDSIRRPGAVGFLHDHVSILAPLGALPVEDDRRRLLADLMDDCLLPLGSALLSGPLGGAGKDGKGTPTLGIGSVLGDEAIRLESGQLRLVDLPPGISAKLDVDPGEGTVAGVEGRRFSLELRGGLGGLLLDTRDIPLDLPPGGEQRRAMLEAWESPAWAGSER